METLVRVSFRRKDAGVERPPGRGCVDCGVWVGCVECEICGVWIGCVGYVDRKCGLWYIWYCVEYHDCVEMMNCDGGDEYTNDGTR